MKLKTSLLTLLAMIILPWTQTFAEDELLQPEQAFKLSVISVEHNLIRAQWMIEPGYYLYRSKFRFKSLSDGISLGEPAFPKGKIKNDEYFGEVEIYRNQVSVDIPIERVADSNNTLIIETTSQGCADIGVCYPPFRQKSEVKLLSPKTTQGSETGLNGLFTSGSDEDEILEPDQAFKYSAFAIDPNTVIARWEIEPKHYLYKDKFKFSIANNDTVSLGSAIIPQGEEKDDEFFGRIEVFHDLVEVKLPLNRTRTDAAEIELNVSYQGCAEVGICYPPQKKQTRIKLSAADKVSNSSQTTQVASTTPASSAPVSEQDSLAASLATGNTFTTILLFFGLGLLLAFTPCVFPMIPILSSIIVGQGDSLTTRRAFTLSLVYVLAMALTYTFAGIIAGLFGANLQAAFQNPIILSVFSGIFVLLALSMFGFYELQLPSALQSKLATISNNQQSGSLAGVAIMGLLSALIVGPCVAPPLMGALIYIGQTGDAVLGGIALFSLSLGMGAPLLLIGTSAGKFLPRAGGWMDAVKAVFGVALLAVAIWMLERILPAAIIMTLWAILLITSSIYMGTLEPLAEAASGWKKLWKGIGVILLLQGAMILAGVAMGNSDPLQPLKGTSIQMVSTNGQAATSSHITFKTIKGVEGLNQAIAQANAEGKGVMLDFYADWCISCKEFEKYTFSDPDVIRSLSGVVTLQADVTANDDADQALLKHFKLIGPPAILFFGKDGMEYRNHRVVGYMEADAFAKQVDSAFSR